MRKVIIILRKIEKVLNRKKIDFKNDSSSSRSATC